MLHGYRKGKVQHMRGREKNRVITVSVGQCWIYVIGGKLIRQNTANVWGTEQAKFSICLRGNITRNVWRKSNTHKKEIFWWNRTGKIQKCRGENKEAKQFIWWGNAMTE